MSKIRGKNTNPEMILRSILFRQGFRFRVHKKDLPGKPDIVLSKYKTVIFVHGCFWHFHKDCREGRIPPSNTEFWKAKLEKNVERDVRHKENLEKLGWTVLTAWECEIEKSLENVVERIVSELKKRSSS